MSHQKIILIAAIAENGVIGQNGKLPWQLPDDLRFFKQQTLNKPVLMGRRTFESVGCKALPGRLNVVIGKSIQTEPPVLQFGNLESALNALKDQPEIMIAGGRQLYLAAWPYATDFLLTRIEAQPEGDIQMPFPAEPEWTLCSAEYHPADEKHCYGFWFEHWKKQKD